MKMLVTLVVGSLMAATPSMSSAACPTGAVAFANRQYQGEGAIFNRDGSVALTWTATQRFDSSGMIAAGQVFVPGQPGQPLTYTATTTSLDTAKCSAAAQITSSNDFNHSGTAVFDQSGGGFQYIGATPDGLIVKVNMTRQSRCQPPSFFARKSFSCQISVLDPSGTLSSAWTAVQTFEPDGLRSRGTAYFAGTGEPVTVTFDAQTTSYDMNVCSGTADTVNQFGDMTTGTFTMLSGKTAGWEYVGRFVNSTLAGSTVTSRCRLQ
jgi:hypothetical protein